MNSFKYIRKSKKEAMRVLVTEGDVTDIHIDHVKQ